MTSLEILRPRIGSEQAIGPEQVDAQISRETGVTPVPSQPTKLKDEQGQVIVESVGDEGSLNKAVKTINVLVSEKTARGWRSGSISDARTWLGVSVLRKIKQAMHFGWKMIVGGNGK